MSNKSIGRKQPGPLVRIIEWVFRVWEFILSIFRPGPRIDGFAPKQGYPGTVLEINGAKFSITRADNHVEVGGKAALVLPPQGNRPRGLFED